MLHSEIWMYSRLFIGLFMLGVFVAMAAFGIVWLRNGSIHTGRFHAPCPFTRSLHRHLGNLRRIDAYRSTLRIPFAPRWSPLPCLTSSSWS